MYLSKKISISLLWAIIFITIINIFSFYFFYRYYFNIYLEEKVTSRKEITIEYINKLVEKQTNEEIDEIFNNIEIQFFELLDKNKWKIKLDKEENVNIVINYLLKAWISPKYMEDVIPENYFEKLITVIKNNSSPEYRFFNKLTKAMLLVNLFSITFLIISLLIFTKKIIFPIKEIADKITKIKIWKDFRIVEYEKKDEIWQLVSAINDLNTKLNIQEQIRSKLIADISHELKTPITSIQCYLEWIKDNVIKLDDKILTNITSEMHRLIKLVNKIMDYEKFDNSEIILKLEDNYIKYLTEKIINQFKLKLKENNQKIITLWNDKLLKIDKDSFIQIIQNIISNFIKYAWYGTILKIEFWTNYIKFFDNWRWVKKEELPYIKEKFYQVKNSKTWDIDDRWIWIWFSIMEKIILAHKWDMELSSDTWKWFEIKIITKTSH